MILVDVNVAGHPPLGDLREMVLDDGFFMLMLCDPYIVMPKAVNEILAPSSIGSSMEKLGDGIPQTDPVKT